MRYFAQPIVERADVRSAQISLNKSYRNMLLIAGGAELIPVSCATCKWGDITGFRKTREDPLGQRPCQPTCTNPQNGAFDRVFGTSEVDCVDVIDQCDNGGWFEVR